MQEHLTDEQLADRFAGGANTPTHEHLTACPACREEEELLNDLQARYRKTVHAAAHRPEAFWQWQRTAIAAQSIGRLESRRLAWATAAAAMVLLAMLLIERMPPPKPLAQSDPDHALLVDVDRSVRRELPRALEPAALLAQEVSRGSEARSNP